MNAHDAEPVTIRHQRGCTIVILSLPNARGRLILRGLYRTLPECLAAVDAGAEVRSVTVV